MPFGVLPARGSTARGASRLAWVDGARALAIIGVVLLHASIGHTYWQPHSATDVVAIWDRINHVVGVFRMPLLFLVSGMLASGKIHRGFRGGNAVLAAVTNYYLYVVWLGVYGVFFLLSGDVHVPFKPATFSDYAIQVLVPQTSLWFVFWLAVYMVVFTALRRVPPVVVVGATALIHLWAATTWSVTSPLWTRGIEFAVFFALGVYARRGLIQYGPRLYLLPIGIVATTALFFVVGMPTVMTMDPLTPVEAITGLALELSACLTGLGIAALLARLRPLRIAGSWVGVRTLGIYVLHIPVLVVVDLGVQFGLLPWIPHLTGTVPVFDALYPVLLTAFVVVSCVLIETTLGRARLGHLFRLPDRWRRKLYRR